MANTKPRIMKDGSIVYPMRGYEPPPSIQGYTRKSNDPRSNDAWIFIPDFKTCKYRKEQEVLKPTCNCYTFISICTLSGLEINTTTCETCPHRHE
jgi:hypothetical protein